MINRLSAVVPVALIALLAGCASPWEKSFQANPLVERQFPPTNQVDMRVVEFERLQNYETAEHERRVRSTTAPKDYTAAERLSAKDRLLEALQLTERGNSVVVLGSSRFIDTDQLNLRSESLAKFAKKIGANVVVASGAFVGQFPAIVDYPLTTYTNYYVYGRRRPHFGTASSTVWVPATVIENEYCYEAVFLRRLAPSPSPPPGSAAPP